MTSALSGQSILVVEDEMMVLMNIEMALQDEGCTATSAGTVEAALALIANTSFDAAMLDVNLRGENSYPIADALAALGVPFIFSTGYGESEDFPRFGGRTVLHKPYVQSDLIAALCSLISPKPALN